MAPTSDAPTKNASAAHGAVKWPRGLSALVVSIFAQEGRNCWLARIACWDASLSCWPDRASRHAREADISSRAAPSRFMRYKPWNLRWRRRPAGARRGLVSLRNPSRHSAVCSALYPGSDQLDQRVIFFHRQSRQERVLRARQTARLGRREAAHLKFHILRGSVSILEHSRCNIVVLTVATARCSSTPARWDRQCDAAISSKRLPVQRPCGPLSGVRSKASACGASECS